jgi:hypothetical protein
LGFSHTTFFIHQYLELSFFLEWFLSFHEFFWAWVFISLKYLNDSWALLLVQMGCLDFWGSFCFHLSIVIVMKLFFLLGFWVVFCFH